MLLGLFANKLCFWRSKEIKDLLGQCPEAGSAQDTASCMPPTLKISYDIWERTLFTSAHLHNFTLGKVKEICLTV